MKQIPSLEVGLLTYVVNFLRHLQKKKNKNKGKRKKQIMTEREERMEKRDVKGISKNLSTNLEGGGEERGYIT